MGIVELSLLQAGCEARPMRKLKDTGITDSVHPPNTGLPPNTSIPMEWIKTNCLKSQFRHKPHLPSQMLMNCQKLFKSFLLRELRRQARGGDPASIGGFGKALALSATLFKLDFRLHPGTFKSMTCSKNTRNRTAVLHLSGLSRIVGRVLPGRVTAKRTR